MEDRASATTALAHYEARRYAEAAETYQALLKADPKNVGLLYNLGCTLQAWDRGAAAIEVYTRGTSLDPTHLGMLNNLANALRGEGRYPEAIALFERLLELDPGKTNAHLNLGLALLAHGDYTRGWAEYEWRHAAINYHRELRKTRPAWDGDPATIKGKRLFVYGAQGLGDEIQCARFLPALTELGARVILEVQAPLKPLFDSMEAIETLYVRESGPLPAFDQHVELFSLPGHIGVTLESIPPPKPLAFRPDLDLQRLIRTYRESQPERQHVGFIWTGHRGNSTNLRRSIAPAAFQHLATTLCPDRLQLYSLQKGASEAPPPCAIDLAPHLHDFASTATAFAELDQIISIDSAVGHLAGNQGVRLSLLLHDPCDWRWLPEGEGAWYPEATMYRQPAPGQWMPALEALARDLL